MITTTISKLDKIDYCIKCRTKIGSLDQYYLQTKDGIYHLQCLRCHYCNLQLHDQVNCYNRNGNIYCKIDYERLFNQSINICKYCGVKPTNGEFIQRTKSNNLFHLKCFKCSICENLLKPGQQYTEIKNSELICELHLTKSIKSKDKQIDKELFDKKLQLKNKRNRTSFKLNQLSEMKTFFDENKNPNSIQLNQLAIYTGLQPRVLRVWFQNMRAKTRRNFLKKKSIGPLVASESINLSISDIEFIEDENNCKSTDLNREEHYCFNVSKHDQYNWLFENLANQFLVFV